MISILMLTLTKQIFDNQLIDLHIFIEKFKKFCTECKVFKGDYILQRNGL